MQRITLFLLAILFTHTLSAQSLKKYAIGTSGCSAYMFCDPGAIKAEKSPDSSGIYKAECVVEKATYGMICVKFNDPMETADDAETVLTGYMDFLKKTFKVTKAAGYGKGHRLKNDENTRGVVDYWEDEYKDSWKVKGWATKGYLVVMYVYATSDIPESKANVFFEGFRFPGMK